MCHPCPHTLFWCYKSLYKTARWIFLPRRLKEIQWSNIQMKKRSIQFIIWMFCLHDGKSVDVSKYLEKNIWEHPDVWLSAAQTSRCWTKFLPFQQDVSASCGPSHGHHNSKSWSSVIENYLWGKTWHTEVWRLETIISNKSRERKGGHYTPDQSGWVITNINCRQ